jgi:hypothetical protein
VPSAGTRKLLALHGDEAAFGAAAGAAECALALDELAMTDASGPLFSMSRVEDILNPRAGFTPLEAYNELWKAAESRLGPLSPAALRLVSAVSEARLTDLVTMAGLALGEKEGKLVMERCGELASLLLDTAEHMRKALGHGAPETLRASALVARLLVWDGLPVSAAPFYARILDALEGCAPGSVRGDARGVPKITPDRLGRDRLAARAGMAGGLLAKGNLASVAALLSPFTDALPELLPESGGRPLNSYLTGQALLLAGEAASGLGDRAGAGELLRRSLASLHPALVAPSFLGMALELAAGIFAGRGDPDSLREAGGLREAASELRASTDGPDCLLALGALANAAGILGRAVDAGIPGVAGDADIHERAGDAGTSGCAGDAE